MPIQKEGMDMVFSSPMGRRFAHFICLGMMFWAGDAAARSPISLDALRRAGYGSVELIRAGQNRLFIPAEINGKKINLLLDTGWGSDGISIGMNPAEFQIVPSKGGYTSLTASGAQVRMGHGTARLVVMGNVRIEGTPIHFGRISLSGVVGHGFLKRTGAIIDLTNLRLYLRPPGKGRRVDLGPALTAMGMTKVPFANSRGTFVVNVEVNGLPTQMALDTGAQFTTLDVRFARAARAAAWGRRDVASVDAAGVVSASDFAGTKSFKIDGVPVRTPTVFTTRFAGYDVTGGKMAGLLGLDVIGMNWGIIDVGQQKFYFSRAH